MAVDQALRSTAQQQEAPQRPAAIRILESQKALDGLKAVCGKVLNHERLAKLAIFSISKTPLLQRCTPSSILGSLMLSATFGLEPNTPSQQAFLIPYRKRKSIDGKWQDVYECQFQFGYRGLITLGYRSGIVTALKAEAIRENDEFDYSEGSEQFLKFKKSLVNRGHLIGAFCFTRLKTEEYAATVLPAEHILKIRAKSETFQSLSRAVDDAKNDAERMKAQKKLDETPWVAWDDNMWMKTAVKAHQNQLPIFDTTGATILSSAATIDDAADSGVLDMSDFTDPEVAIGASEGQIDLTKKDQQDEEGEQQAPQLQHEKTVPYTIQGGKQAPREEATVSRQEAREEPQRTAKAAEAPRETVTEERTPPKPRQTKAAAPPPPADEPPPSDDPPPADEDEGAGNLFSNIE